MGAFGADRCEHVTKTNLRRRPVPSFVSDEPRPRFSFRETSRNRNSALSAPCARVPSRGRPSRARFAMSDTHHRRPPTGVQPGIAPTVGRPMPRSAEASQKLWKSLQDVTSKVAPSVSSSLKEIGSSTKEVWLDPLREITRDIAGDVREAFRPGGASEAHASLRATAADARGATPRNVGVARVPAASASSEARRRPRRVPRRASSVARAISSASAGLPRARGWSPPSPRAGGGDGHRPRGGGARAARKRAASLGRPGTRSRKSPFRRATATPSGRSDADRASTRRDRGRVFQAGRVANKKRVESERRRRARLSARDAAARRRRRARRAALAAAAASARGRVRRPGPLAIARRAWSTRGAGGEPGGSEPATETRHRLPP